MFQDIKHYGLVTYIDRASGKVHNLKVWDAVPVRKEERRLRKVVSRMIKSVPREEQPKPSLVWTNTLIDNLGATVGAPFQMHDDDPGSLTFALDFSGQMLLHASAMGLLKYLGYQSVFITNAPIGFMYVELPGTTEEVLERVERDGVMRVLEHALAMDVPTAWSATDYMIEKLRAQQPLSRAAE